MPGTDFENTNIKKTFVYLAGELSSRFPELDLRFNLQTGTDRFRVIAAAVSNTVIELPIAKHECQDLLHAAIFELKELAQLFDD